MGERVSPSPVQENRATRINYSARAKGFMALSVFFPIAVSLAFFEKSQTGQRILPDFAKGRLYDTMAVPVIASFDKFRGDDKFENNLATGLMVPTMMEMGQWLGLYGTFDWGDFAAYGLGAAAWVVFDRTAKAVHDSGLTLPIYRALKIKHKKFG